VSDAAYRARERQLLQQLAWQTLNDPKASPDDKRAARERLEQCNVNRYEWNRLTLDERRTLLALSQKAAGKEPKAPLVVPLPAPADPCATPTATSEPETERAPTVTVTVHDITAEDLDDAEKEET